MPSIDRNPSAGGGPSDREKVLQQADALLDEGRRSDASNLLRTIGIITDDPQKAVANARNEKVAPEFDLNFKTFRIKPIRSEVVRPLYQVSLFDRNRVLAEALLEKLASIDLKQLPSPVETPVIREKKVVEISGVAFAPLENETGAIEVRVWKKDPPSRAGNPWTNVGEGNCSITIALLSAFTGERYGLFAHTPEFTVEKGRGGAALAKVGSRPTSTDEANAVERLTLGIADHLTGCFLQRFPKVTGPSYDITTAIPDFAMRAEAFDRICTFEYQHAQHVQFGEKMGKAPDANIPADGRIYQGLPLSITSEPSAWSRALDVFNMPSVLAELSKPGIVERLMKSARDGSEFGAFSYIPVSK